LKIGIFHPPINMYGGAEVVAVVSANALAQNGYEVVLFTDKPVNEKRIAEMVGEPLDLSIKVIINPSFLHPRGMFHLYESAVRSLSFNSYCDVLFDTYSCYVFPWIDVSYLHFPYLNNFEFKPNFPYLKHPHVRHALTVPYAVFEKNLEDYDKKLLLTNSYFTARVIKDSLGVEPKVLYPPIPNVLFEKKDTNFKLSRKDLVITLARFGQGKGVELVPEIAARTAKNIHFKMIGLAHDLNVVQAVKRKIKDYHLEDRVTIVTDASRQQVISLLSQAKVYLHTTKMEHFGMSIAEAMAMGCIPVVHDSGGAPEFVPNKYRYKDKNDASKKVDNAIEHWTPEEGQKIMKSADRFSETNYTKRLIELFNSYCGS
jgi:glycosyltransferase involved in cell wall biosynthesis